MSKRFASLSPNSSDSEDDNLNVAPMARLDATPRTDLRLTQSETTPIRATSIPMPSSGIELLANTSSPIHGTKEQKAQQRREKAARRRRAKMEASQQDLSIDAKVQEEKDLQAVHDFLRLKGLRFGQYMKFVFDPDGKQGNIRWQEFFKHEGEARQILDWWASSQNSDTAQNEVSEWAVDFVAGLVANNARDVTRSKRLQTIGKVVDHDLVNSFSYTGIHRELLETAPVAMRLLKAFTTSPKAGKHTKRRQGQTETVITSTALACLGEYSHANNLSKRMMALYLYATGAQRQTISVLSTLGLSESYTNLITKNERRERKKKATNLPLATDINQTTPTATLITDDEPGEAPKNPAARYTGTLRQLSESMRAQARSIAAHGPYSTVYDNINMMFRNAEQLIGRHDTQENGTCATLLPLFGAHLADLNVESFRVRFLTAGKLMLRDLLLTRDEASTFRKHLIFTILRIIVKNGGAGFKKFDADLDKYQPTTKDKIELHTTDIHPLPTWNIDESSITGNIEVDAAIVKELELDKNPDFWKRLRFHGGDQLSLARFRAIENIRAGQEHGYNAFFGSTWLPGLFHTKIADATGTLFTHWGKPDTGARNPGSLWFHNTRLNRLPITLTSLPSFRVCRDLIFVSLYARVLNCLIIVASVDTLDEYLIKFGSWKLLETHAEHIYDRFAQTSIAVKLRQERAREERSKVSDRVTAGDMVFENAVLFMRDALISREFSDAIKAGDSGRVLLVLKTWALSFRGNGRSKYAYEMLHLIHNFTTVWSTEIRKIVLNNWLVNPTGQPNSWVEIDLMQEHLNYWIKVFYKAHGANATWEWLEWISPCVNVLRKLTKSFNDVLGSDQGTRHAPADLTDDIRSLMDSLRENDVYYIKKGRILDDEDGVVKDIITIGLESLCDGTKNVIYDYNDAFTRLQTRRKTKPVIPGSLAPENMADNSSTTHTKPNLGSPLILQEHGSYTHPLAEGDDHDAEDEPQMVSYLDDMENGICDSDTMLTVTTAADVDLNMDEIEFEDEMTEDESEDEEE